MKYHHALRSRIVVSKAFINLFLLATFLLLAVVLISLYSGIPVSEFTRDPLAIAGGRPFYGFVSNIGVIMWSASMALCFFSYFLLKASNASGKVPYFVFSGGALSLILLLDDLFMLHEHFFPRYFGYGEKVVFLTYGLLLLIYVAVFLREFLKRAVSIYVALFFSLLFPCWSTNSQNHFFQCITFLKMGQSCSGLLVGLVSIPLRATTKSNPISARRLWRPPQEVRRA